MLLLPSRPHHDAVTLHLSHMPDFVTSRLPMLFLHYIQPDGNHFLHDTVVLDLTSVDLLTRKAEEARV